MSRGAEVLRVADLHPACTVLGPGCRFAVWVQGCPLACRECISPQWIPDAGGTEMDVADLAATIAAQAVDGLTVSGGEPFAQAGALCRLVDEVRYQKDLSVMVFTGYTLEHLRAHGTAEQRMLLERLDLLIDGPYLARRHTDALWRGSANQRVHRLTGRHADLSTQDSSSAGLQFEITPGGQLQWMGVPAIRGFRERLEQALDLAVVGQTKVGTVSA